MEETTAFPALFGENEKNFRDHENRITLLEREVYRFTGKLSTVPPLDLLPAGAALSNVIVKLNALLTRVQSTTDAGS